MFGGLAAALGVLALDVVWHVELSEVAQFLMLTPFSLICAVVGTYLGQPTERAVLENFYRETRPFGFWAPLTRILPDNIRNAMRTEHRKDLLALPCAFVWMVTMYLLPMQLIIKQYTAFAATLVLFVLSVAGLYQFWYKNLPPSSVPTQATKERE
jgi:hypothetical protein